MIAAWQRVLVIAAAAALALALAWSMLELAAPAIALAPLVQANLAHSGVRHPLTAVLLNFRSYDTLLEIAVLQLAVLGVLVAPDPERHAGQRARLPQQALLRSLARTLAPLMVLVAGYLLWSGAHQPGGAFQAGAVLAAAAVLLFLAGLSAPWMTPALPLRVLLCAGLLLFLAVAVLAPGGCALLQYPRHLAGALILAIEAGLTVSIGLALTGLFLWLPDDTEEAEP
jgi:multisubunit Na+/H+ antiporter MnhB subunit